MRNLPTEEGISSPLAKKPLLGRVAPLHDALVTDAGEAGELAHKRDLRKAPHHDWHDDIGPAFKDRYRLLGQSMDLWEHDWALLRRTCGEQHPSQITVKEMERQVLRVKAQATRATYVIRFKSIWRTLRAIGAVPLDHQPDTQLPNIRKPRAMPRPISMADAELLMSPAAKPREREFFTLALLAGLRSMEVAAIEGSWLEQDYDGYTLRVRKGKGNTDLAIPCHERLVILIQSHNTLGPLYGLTNGTVSDLANAEMKRLGVRGTFHGCRHFFITLIYQQTGDLLLASELARHQNLNTTRGYAALKQGRKREALDQLFAEGGAVNDEVIVSA